MEGTIGEVRLFAGNFAPLYWAFCDGHNYSIAEYTPLYAIIGTTFGGDGQVTFSSPNLLGRAAIGTGYGGSSGLSIDNGEMGGSNTVTLLTSQMPAHTHAATATPGTVTVNVTSANATISTPTPGSAIATPGTGSGRSFAPTFGYDPSTPSVALNFLTLNKTGMVVSNSATGGSQPHNNMMPYLGVNFIICMEGIFPIRN